VGDLVVDRAAARLFDFQGQRDRHAPHAIAYRLAFPGRRCYK
jgi:hypothetical protein